MCRWGGKEVINQPELEEALCQLKHERWHQFKRLLKSNASKERLLFLMDVIDGMPTQKIVKKKKVYFMKSNRNYRFERNDE